MTHTASTSHSYSDRLMRRIVPFFAFVISIASGIMILTIITNQLNTLSATHRNAIERAIVDVTSRLQPIIDNGIDVSQDVRLRNFLENKGNTRDASQSARDLISSFPTSVLAIRFRDATGVVRLEVTNVRGFPQITVDAQLALNDREQQEPAFYDSLGTREGVTFGKFQLQRDPKNGLTLNPPRPVISLYVPVILTNATIAGALQVEVDPTDILNIVNRAEVNFIDPLPNRHALFLVDSNLILADSSAPNQSYLASLQNANGNIANNEFYDSLRPFFTTDASEQFTTQYSAGNMVSAHPLTFDNTNPVAWRILIVDNVLSAYATGIGSAIVIALGTILLGVFGGIVVRAIVIPTLEPVETAANMVVDLARANNQTAPANAPLADSVTYVANQMSTLNKSFDQQVTRRNRDLTVMGRIGYETAVLDDLDALLKLAINLICNQMGFYHAQVFLVDELNNTAVLAYSRGEAGQEMLARGHKIAIGSPTIIGTVTAQRRAVIINDVTSEANEVKHGFNPLLPDTQAEMGMPLIIGDQLIGALDIQSVKTNVFLKEDVPTFELLANQLAVAIYNAQLKTQSDRRIQQIDRLNRQLTLAAWQDVSQEIALEPLYGTVNDTINEKVTASITIRGESIGEIEASLPDGQSFTEGDQVIIQAVAERVAIAIENARLFQETQISLAETSTLYSLSQQLNEATTLEDVLQAVISSVSPDASGAQLWLFDDYMSGGTPTTVRLAVDLPVMPRAENLDSLIGQPLAFSDFEFSTALNNSEAAFVADVATATDMDDAIRALFLRIGTVTLVIIPLNMRGVWKGFITLQFNTVRPYGEREQRIYNALIVQAGVAIDNRILLQQTEDALSRNEKLYAASRLINTTRNLQDLVYAAVATTSDLSLNFWLGLLEGDADLTGWRDRVRIVAKSDSGTVTETDEVIPLDIETNSPMRLREPQIWVDDDDNPNNRLVTPAFQRLRELHQRFMAIFPLYIDNAPIALFYIVSKQPHALTAEDYEVYKALTGQMSTQIQNRRLLARTEAALNETTRLYVASRAISSVQDLTSLYNTVAGHIATPFAQTTSDNPTLIALSILLARPQASRDATQLEYVYQWSSDANATARSRVGTFLNQMDAPLAAMIENSDENILVYNNISQLKNNTLKTLLRQDVFTSAAIAPIQVRQMWFGALIIHTDKPELLNEGYVRFMQAIADQVAVALENQSLLGEAQFERANLNNILSTLPAGVLVLNPETFVPVQINERVEQLLGRKIDYTQPFTAEYYNVYRTGTNLYYPNDELPIFSANEQNRPMFADDLSIIDELTQTDLLVNAAPIYDSTGRKTAIVAAFQDISNLRSLENTLQENLRETVALYESQRALSESETLDDLLNTILTQLAMQQTSDVQVVLSNESDGSLSLARYLMNPIEDLEALRPLLRADFVIVDDINQTDEMDEACRKAFLAFGTGSLMVTPMRTKTRPLPLGWLILTDEKTHTFTADQERMLVTLADMASTAVDNNYLVESTQAALQETAALYSAATTINRARDIFELSSALQSALENMQPDFYAGYLIQDGNVQELFNLDFDQFIGEADLAQLVTLELPIQDNVFLYKESSDSLSELEYEIHKMHDLKGLACVNLRIKDVAGGRLFIGFDKPHAFNDSDTRFLNTVADSASVVVDNIVLLDQIQSTLQETSVLYQASRALIETNNPQEIVDVIVNYLIEPHITQVFVAMLNRPRWDSAASAVDVVATWQPDGMMSLQGVSLTPDQFPAWRQLATESVLTINDVDDEDLDIDIVERICIQSLDTRSLVVIPLRVPNRAIGAIWLGSNETHMYTDRDLRIFQAFAEQTSLSLEAARLLEQTEKRATQLQTTAQISERVGQILDLDVLLPQVVNLIRDQFAYDHVQVFLMDDNDDYAVLRASTGEAGEKLLGVNHKLQKGSKSVIGQVTALSQVTIALDTTDANVVHKPNPYLPLTRSEMALPLSVKGVVVGALDVQSNQPNAFSDEDIQTLSTLAAQISIAIDNARLYEETQGRANELGFLLDVTTAATAADNLAGSLQSIIERLYEALEPLTVAIYLPKTYVDFNQNIRQTLKPSALAGTQQPLSELSEIQVGDSENLIGIVGSTLQSQIVPNVDKEVRYIPIAPQSKSAILVPIGSGAELVGLFVMEAETYNAYSHDTLTLLLTLSGSLSAIIQNTLLVDQLQTTNDQLREVDRLKSQFLANMSHELRTPLNSIIGFSRVMLKGIDGTLTEMQEQDLNTIYNSGNHLLNLINDILDQAKIEANEMQLKFAYFDVKPMIESVKSIAVGLLKDKSLQLFVEVAPNMPQAYGDEFRSRQILLNLVSNAVKFTQQGSVTIRVYQSPNVSGKNMIRADVIDSGIGIADKDLPILFEQFRQVDNSLTRTAGGTGLGLPISKSLTELQGGQLLVSSEVGKGSTFSVTIPTEPMAEAEKRQKEHNDPKPAHNGNGGTTDTAIVRRPNELRDTQSSARVELPPMPVKRDVLLIEDNKDMVDQFRRALQREGFEVQTADHPSYAEAMVGQLRPTMVVMDVNFANGVGWDILKNLKERDDTLDVPIIVTTLNGDIDRAYRLGANKFLQRPFMPDALISAVLEIEKEHTRERILIIDDQPDAVRLLKQLLDEHGNYRIYIAESGKEGISMVARRRPNLVILDLRMPEMDGFEVLNELRSNPETANIPVMIVTGDIDLNATEQDQLTSIRVLQKTDITAQEYNRFLNEVKNELKNR